MWGLHDTAATVYAFCSSWQPQDTLHLFVDRTPARVYNKPDTKIIHMHSPINMQYSYNQCLQSVIRPTLYCTSKVNAKPKNGHYVNLSNLENNTHLFTSTEEAFNDSNG